MVLFDGLPVSAEKFYLRQELLRVEESWAAARFDSLTHVVHILTSRDREAEVQFLKDQSDIVEEVVDEVVHAYHSGFNKAIQNYSQILRLFSESAESISFLKVDLAEAKKLVGSRNKQLHQLWYRSVTLHHIISLLDQIEDVAKVPARIERLIGEKQLYSAVQLHVQSTLMLEREGLQVVLCWAQAMPKYAGDLVKYVQTFLERTYERCRTSYMEAVLEKQSYMVIGRHDIEGLMRMDPASAYLPSSSGRRIPENNATDSETVEVETEISDLLLKLCPIKQEYLIRDDNKLILLASLSDSLEYLADSIERLGQTSLRSSPQTEEQNKAHHTQTSSAVSRDLASFAEEYRKLAIDCLKVLRVEMQLETIFHMQEMTSREYLEDQDAEEPDDFIISLTAQITRMDEEMAPFVADIKRNYIFGGICSIAANASIKALADIKAINIFGVQQICRNSIALEQALAAIPSIDNEAVQQRLDRVRIYFELLNLPFEALLAFITEHEYLFTAVEYTNLLKVKVPGREVPIDAEQRISEILSP